MWDESIEWSSLTLREWTIRDAVVRGGTTPASAITSEQCARTRQRQDDAVTVWHSGIRHLKLHAEQLSNLGGAKLAARYGALSADHIEYLDEEGVAAMAASGTVAVVLPGAFYSLRETQLPPMEALRRHGVPIALATDCNPGTSPLTSPLLTLNMGCTLFRMTPEEALALVGDLPGGAEAALFASLVPLLEAGGATDSRAGRRLGALDLAASINVGFGYRGGGEGGHLRCFMLSIHPQKREKWWFGRFARRGARWRYCIVERAGGH